MQRNILFLFSHNAGLNEHFQIAHRHYTYVLPHHFDRLGQKVLTPRMDTEDRVDPLWDLPGINPPTSFFQPVSNSVAMLTHET
jgi:hypothetical protein